MSTEGLLRRSVEGDSDAFAEVFRRHAGRLRVWINSRMGPLLSSRVTGDDVLQETFLQAYRSMGTFSDRGPGSLRRWLFSLAENRIRDLAKYHEAGKRRPDREVASSPEEDRLARLAATVSSPSSGAHRQELVAMVIEGIRSLPPELREVFVLRVVEERSLREIGERIQRSPTTVQALFVRALRRLRDEFRRLSGY